MVCCVQQEYEAEQEYIKTLSYLSAEEQRKYKQRQSVSFMYQKPPGMDSGVAKAKVCTAWDQIDIQGNKRCTVFRKDPVYSTIHTSHCSQACVVISLSAFSHP